MSASSRFAVLTLARRVVVGVAVVCFGMACCDVVSAGPRGSTMTAHASSSDEYAPVVGDPHPPLELPTIEHDRTVRLSDYRGKKVLLIHFASW